MDPDETIDTVTVHIDPESEDTGIIEFHINGPIVKLLSGECLSSNRGIHYTTTIEVIIDYNGDSCRRRLTNPVRVRLLPVLITLRHYSPLPQAIEDVYPPSSHGWYSRIQSDGKPHVFTVQPLINDTKFWLTISDSETGAIRESHSVHPFEIASLGLIEDSIILQKLETILSSGETTVSREDILKILDSPSPQLKDLLDIVDDIALPNFRMGDTIRATLSQLVPNNLEHSIREEIMAFVAWTLTNEIPKKDPLDLSRELITTPIYSDLVFGHLGCILSGFEPPNYLKLLNLASKGELRLIKRPQRTVGGQSTWTIFLDKLEEYLPDWLTTGIDYAESLNSSRKITTGLPITRAQAKKSRKAWTNRLLLINASLRLRGQVRPDLVGLSEVLHLGAATTWPTPHTAWTVRLGPLSNRPSYLSVLVMPPSAVEKVRRVKPNLLVVKWIARSSNLNLYDRNSHRWRINSQSLYSNMKNSIKLEKLRSEYGPSQNVGPIHLQTSDPIVMDMVSGYLRLNNMELKNFWEYWGISKRTFSSELSRLRDAEVVDLIYTPLERGLVSLVTIAQGPIQKVQALVASLLRNVPTSLAFVCEKNHPSVVVSRIPYDMAYSISNELPIQGLEAEVNIRCMTVYALRSFTHNLYQRLFRDDGTWLDDVSAFVSQVRSRPRENAA